MSKFTMLNEQNITLNTIFKWPFVYSNYRARLIIRDYIKTLLRKSRPLLSGTNIMEAVYVTLKIVQQPHFKKSKKEQGNK